MTRQQKLAREISTYKGQWVLVKDYKVVAASPSIKTAISTIAVRDRKNVRAQYCPTEDYSGASFSAL